MEAKAAAALQAANDESSAKLQEMEKIEERLPVGAQYQE